MYPGGGTGTPQGESRMEDSKASGSGALAGAAIPWKFPRNLRRPRSEPKSHGLPPLVDRKHRLRQVNRLIDD